MRRRRSRFRRDADPAAICLLGCGASTGVGAVVNTAACRRARRSPVIGLGGIGLAALQAATIAGAARVIAVDLVAGSWRWRGGWEPPIRSMRRSEDAVVAVRALTRARVSTRRSRRPGTPSVVAQAVGMLARGGIAVAIGVPAPAARSSCPGVRDRRARPIPTRPRCSSPTAGTRSRRKHFPRWTRWYLDGRLDLDDFVTHHARLTDDDLNDAFRAMLAGRSSIGRSSGWIGRTSARRASGATGVASSSCATAS